MAGSPLRDFFHSLATVSANVINATPEESEKLHECANKCADEYEANGGGKPERAEGERSA